MAEHAKRVALFATNDVGIHGRRLLYNSCPIAKCSSTTVVPLATLASSFPTLSDLHLNPTLPRAPCLRSESSSQARPVRIMQDELWPMTA